MQDDAPTNQQPGESGGTPGELSAAVPPDMSPDLPPDLRGKISLGLISLGCVILMVFMFRMLRRARSGGQARHETALPRRPGSPPPPPTQAHERLEQLMGDAEELTRRLAAILDNKAARLEVLIQQADERAGELGALSSRPAASPTTPEPAERRPRAPEPEPRDAVDPFHRRVYELADQGLKPVDIARRIDRPTGQVELILALRRA